MNYSLGGPSADSEGKQLSLDQLLSIGAVRVVQPIPIVFSMA